MDLSGPDEENGPNEEKGIVGEKGADEKKGSGPLAGLLDHAKCITKSLDNTISTLLKLKEGIQDTGDKIRENQDTLAKSLEVLKGSVSKAAIASNRRTSVNDRVYSLDERAARSRISEAEEEKGKGKGSFTTT